MVFDGSVPMSGLPGLQRGMYAPNKNILEAAFDVSIPVAPLKSPNSHLRMEAVEFRLHSVIQNVKYLSFGITYTND